MATFEIESSEGTRWAKVTLQDETVVAERGALSWLTGDIQMKARLPGPIRLIRAVLSGEEAFRPTFTGTGSLYLESSLGGFHELDLPGDETWVIESGAYWASEAKVHQTFIREKMWTSLRIGEGFLSFQTKVSGKGKVMLCAAGPVEEVILSKSAPNGGRIMADGKQVLARTAGVKYSVQLPGWLPWSQLTSGERLLRTYEGEGRLLMCTTPYWRFMMAQKRQADEIGLEAE
jgi:uncharacterized protein (AIM24 family)